MELNREIHTCHRCTFSICRLPPSLPPSPRSLSFYPPVFSLHPFCGWIRCGLSSFGLLLTWVSAGGASCWRLLLRGQPILACGGGKKGWNISRVEETLRLQQPRLSELEPITSAKREQARERNRAVITSFLPSTHYERAHIDWASMCRV